MVIEQDIQLLQSAILNKNSKSAESIIGLIARDFHSAVYCEDFYSLQFPIIQQIVSKYNEIINETSLYTDVEHDQQIENIVHLFQTLSSKNVDETPILINHIHLPYASLQEITTIFSSISGSPLCQQMKTLFDTVKQNSNVQNFRSMLEKQQLPPPPKPDVYESNIFTACRIGDLSSLRYLIEIENKDVDGQNNFGWAPIHIAASHGHIDIVRYLVSQGTNIEIKRKDDWTPLHVACKNGHYKVVEFLISKGAEINSIQNEGCTPLYIAAQKGYSDIVHLLLLRGADKTVKSKNGLTAFDVAIKQEIRELLQQNEAKNEK